MTDLRYGVLGPLEVVRDGKRVAINGPKLRVLLATLLLQANATVSMDQLGERMWGERPPSTARKSVQLYVMRLRRAIGDDSVIETRPDGYLLNADADQVDLLRFRRLTIDAREAARTGDLLEELNKLNDALACWRGPALSDVPSESLQREAVAELAEDKLRTEERRIQVHLDLGRHREVISELVQLTKDHPWQEQFWVQLIQALHRSDRLADALDTYRTVHRKFRDELGIDPGPQMQQVHSTLLAERPDLSGEVLPMMAAPINQLPAALRDFVGREELVQTLSAMRGPITVVSGPPGVGKTAFTLHVAHRLRDHFPDGQLYVNLQGYASDPPLVPATVLNRFLRTLGVAREEIPADLEGQAALFRSVLTGKQMLVVLDNAVDAEQVRPLLPAEAGCRVLITSRSDLRGLAVNPGADHLRLNVLTAPESQAVLTELIGEERAEAEPDALAELTNACAHLPLALRIAGANLAANPHRLIADYVAEMKQSGRLAELAIDGDETSAVRVAFDNSYLRLRESDQKLFRLLGSAPGPDVSVGAAAALAGDSLGETNRALDRLTAAALMYREFGGRYHFHDLIREYAISQDTPTDSITALTRLADYYLHTANAAARLLYPATPRLPLPVSRVAAVSLTDASALRWLDEERHNLVAVVTWAATHPVLRPYAWRLVDVLRGYLQARGYDREALTGFEAALRAAEDAGEPAAQISILDVLGLMSYNLADYQEAIDYHNRALAVAAQINDLDAAAQALHNLGRIHMQQGQPKLAEDYHRQALEAARKTGNLATEILALNYIGIAQTSAGQPAKALGWHEQSLALSHSSGNRTAAFRATNGLGIAYWNLGELDKAVALQQEVLNYCHEIGERFGELITLVCLAEIQCDLENYETALSHAHKAIALSTKLSERRSEAGAREIIATVHSRNNEFHRAITGYTEALRLCRQIGFRYGEMSVLIGLAAAHRGLGDAELALTYSEQALTKLRAGGQLLLEAKALTELAYAHLALDRREAAKLYISNAISLARERHQRLDEKRALYMQSLLGED
ncbi:tetratricopeptide repeat protein [Kibdelosporangium philippinense]|uniref:Tetratricopeptide repeat protein n=1 Tax=Kibdelosporangium philippinense TaxID=211113 RepID=A0ABS8Z4Q9_9PSEU|nr:BTAD domain-containing putative transcriptional regulator [Kibdelosporangium philippinense]MCE7001563.1 tetratricopeptide repeat protein [Kibdelosporangium philippinense]